MNWQLFSTIGYISVGLWLLVPVLCVLHQLIRPRRWLAHIAVAVSVAALVLAEVNSNSYVSRIQVDMSEQIAEQMSRQAMARQAALDERSKEVADVRFAEDRATEFVDEGGFNDADRAYFESIGADATPDWKKQKGTRSVSQGNDLEDLIGASEEREGVEVSQELEEAPEAEPILMSDRDKTLADRLDTANLKASRYVLLLGVLFLVFDYVRRLNVHREVYLPLPVPSRWADGLSEREVLRGPADKPKRPVLDELKLATRRGEWFVLMTDDPETAEQALKPIARLPLGLFKQKAIDVESATDMDDLFVFETLWFGRSSFVLCDTERSEALFGQVLDCLTERREKRAHTRRTVHVFWDIASPIPEATRQRFEALGRATGFTLLICKQPSTPETDV